MNEQHELLGEMYNLKRVNPLAFIPESDAYIYNEVELFMYYLITSIRTFFLLDFWQFLYLTFIYHT